jgi:hypothetical protein
MNIIQNVYNVETGELTQQIVLENEADEKARLDAEKRFTEQASIAQANAIAKAALLERLGITADEAALLLGGN